MRNITFSSKNQLRSNKIFQIIRDFETYFYDEFQKSGIVRCGHCGGKGLDRHLSFCNDCGGMGYTGFKRLKGEFVCRTCNGYGCSKCNQKGTVDWISHANGNDITEGKIYA